MKQFVEINYVRIKNVISADRPIQSKDQFYLQRVERLVDGIVTTKRLTGCNGDELVRWLALRKKYRLWGKDFDNLNRDVFEVLGQAVGSKMKQFSDWYCGI